MRRSRPKKVGVFLMGLLLLSLLAMCSGQQPELAPTPGAATAVAEATLTEPPPPTATTAPPPAAVPTETATAVLITGTPAATTVPSPTPTATPTPLVFAMIGDFGQAGQPEADVAALVHSWQPEFIITTGDNNYPSGAAETIDENIGQYYADYIYPYTGSYEVTSTIMTNRFFPSLGNHDYQTDDAQPYLDYFTLPGNERYYEILWEPVHVFAVNSNWQEPDGFRADSAQADWLQDALASSQAPWKVVTMHTPPYSSGRHGSYLPLHWPYDDWGATAVLAGHDHVYERLLVDGFPYFVNGLGGFPAIYNFEEILPESQVRYNDDYGAMRVRATAEEITFEFITRTGELIDSYTQTSEGAETQLFCPVTAHPERHVRFTEGRSFPR
jgi:hypothetical protein